MGRKKITVVGGGNVGASTALWVAQKELGDVVLVDILEGMPQGKSLDMMEASPIEGFDSRISGANSYEDTKDSDLVIITAGLARKPGMERSDLIEKNSQILKGIVGEIVKYSPDTTLIIVTNPLDVMVYIAWKESGLKPNKVIGMAGALDGARLRAFLAMELDVSVEDVHAMVIGGHANEMVPLKRYSTVSGIPVSQFIDDKRLDEIMQRTKTAGAEIVNLLKTGSAYYAPSAGAAEMAEAILKDKKRVIPCAAYLSGEYGVDGLFVGAPVVLGANGVEKVLELELDEGEKKAFDESVDAIKNLIKELNI
ncbi:MAG: malate dehydrogenase [Deltaproteobacteria bacterium]|nr:malate dehydrogenase [Deltaproteobacteria bacterium]